LSITAREAFVTPGYAGPTGYCAAMTRDSAERGRLAAAFGHAGVAEAYQHRPPYPPDVFRVLAGLITDQPRDVLDLGAGDGALARPLARVADHVTALDVSAAMIGAGPLRPGGDQPGLRWVLGAAESADLGGPYALVTAGASLHWMSWETTLARVARVMTAGAFLAIVDQRYHELPWRDGLREIVVRHSRSPGFDPDFSLPRALSDAGLLEVAGSAVTPPERFRQPVASYVEEFHSTASLAREWMTAGELAAFDEAVTDLVMPYAPGGMLSMRVVAQVDWGRIRMPRSVQLH
jgi:SAM-dependent methyltransferase